MDQYKFLGVIRLFNFTKTYAATYQLITIFTKKTSFYFIYISSLNDKTQYEFRYCSKVMVLNSQQLSMS